MPRRIFLLIVCLCCPLLWAAKAHDFHVSLSTIDYNPQTRALEITAKIFTDDIERALTLLGAPNLRIGTPQESPETKEYLTRYLQNRIQIKVEGTEHPVQYVGKEAEADATWFYLEITDINPPKQLEITQKVLTELFDDQSNLVHVTIAGRTQTLLLSRQTPTEIVYF